MAAPAYFGTAGFRRIPPDSVAVIFPLPSERLPQASLWQSTTGMRFKLPGGYFLVPSAAGTMTYSPQLLIGQISLTALVFAALAAGTSPPRTPDAQRALLGQLRAWHVESVVAFPEGTANPAEVISYLTWLIGRPPLPRSGAFAWYGRI